MARPGESIAKQSEGRVGEKCLPVGGRMRKLRAAEDQSASVPEETTSKLDRIIEMGDECCTLVRVVAHMLCFEKRENGRSIEQAAVTSPGL